MVLGSSWVVSGGIRGFSWCQIVSTGFRPSLILVSIDRFNVGLDLMCLFLYKKFLCYFMLAFVQNVNHFDSHPSETLE